MLATLPRAKLLFFHVLLIKKGLSTYDYIVALREQEQQDIGGGGQSPEMSQISSFTGMRIPVLAHSTFFVEVLGAHLWGSLSRISLM